MSALQRDERTSRHTTLYYAPRSTRAETPEPSIRAVLARLRREEYGEVLPSEPIDDAPSIAPLLPVSPAQGFTSIILRFAAVAGVCGGVAALAVSLPMQQRKDRAPLVPADLPKPVQTISYKSQARLGDAALPPSAAAVGRERLRDGTNAAVAEPRHESDSALPPSLRLFAALPPGLSSAGWSPVPQKQVEEVVPQKPIDEVAPQPAADAPQHKEHHIAHARHHRRWRVRRHRLARAGAAREQTQQAEQPSGTAKAAEDNSLGTLLHKIFGAQ